MVSRVLAGVVSATVLVVAVVAVLATAAGGEAGAEVVSRRVEGLPTAGHADGQAVTGQATEVLSEPREMPIAFSLVGFSVPRGATVAFRHRVDGGDWSDWTTTEVDRQEGPAGSQADNAQMQVTRAVWTGAADELQLRVGGARPEDVAINLVDGLGQNRSPTERLSDVGHRLAQAVTDGVAPAAAASRPGIITRREWGAAAPSGPPSAAHRARGAVLHHTATSNDYGRSQGPAVVRSIQRYHQQYQGWKDIGYNFLVDRFGRIYQGRAGGVTQPVVGAHAAGHNVGTIGVAFIGQHHAGSAGDTALRHAAANAATDLLAWLFQVHGINPRTEATLPSGYTYQRFVRRIVGHGHLGDTSCPGSSVNAALAGIRRDVVAALEGGTHTGEPGSAHRGPSPGSAQEGPSPGSPHSAPSRGQPGVARLADDTRQATAARVSRHAFDSADTVVIASAVAYPDALAGAGLAGRLGAPVLLTAPGGLDSATRAEIDRLGAQRAVVLGSPTKVTHHVTQDLRRRGLAVERITGDTRFATAAAVASRFTDAETVLIADGAGGWPDAVSASQLAARDKIPVLLTAGAHVPAATHRALRRIDPDDVILVGGRNTVPPQVSAALQRYGRLTRLAGRTRVHTAAQVTNLMAHTGADKQRLWLASANGWADALAAGPAAAHVGGVLQLTWPHRFNAHGPVGRRVRDANVLRLVGGASAISPAVERQSVRHAAR